MTRGRHFAYRKTLKPRARIQRRDPTPAERRLWYGFLSELPQKFTRQKPLGPYIADFYCARYRLVIEVDGDSHFNDQAEGYDARRSAWLQARGVTVLRFTNSDVTQNFDGVRAEVLRALGET